MNQFSVSKGVLHHHTHVVWIALQLNTIIKEKEIEINEELFTMNKIRLVVIEM